MASRSRKSTVRGPSSSRSTQITKRHLLVPDVDPSFVQDIRFRNVIVEHRVDVDHIAPFDILPLLEAVGWVNLLHWGGPAYRSIAQTMFACINAFSQDDLTFIISTREGPFDVDRHLIAALMDIPVNDEGIPIHNLTAKPSVSEKRMLTRDLCNMDVQWTEKGNALPARYLLPKYRILHKIFVSNLYPRSGNKTDLTSFMVRVIHAVASGTKICLPSLICHSILQFRLHPGHSDIPFAYFMTVLATHMLVDMPGGEAPIHHLIFNNNNINKMKLELLPEQGGGGGHAEAAHEREAGDLPPDDIDMDDIFEELDSDDPDYESRNVDARLGALEDKVDNLNIKVDNMSLGLKSMRKYLKRLNKGMHQLDPTIPAPSSSSD